MDWRRIMADPSQPVALVNRLSVALQLCAAGQPAIAVLGVSGEKLAEFIKKRGARVHFGANMN